MQSAAVHYPFGQSFRNVITVLKLLLFLRFGCCWPLCMWVVAEWLACWTQAQMGLGSNRACSAWMWPVGVDPVWSVWVVCCVTCRCRSSVVCVGGLFVCCVTCWCRSSVVCVGGLFVGHNRHRNWNSWTDGVLFCMWTQVASRIRVLSGGQPDPSGGGAVLLGRPPTHEHYR